MRTAGFVVRPTLQGEARPWQPRCHTEDEVLHGAGCGPAQWRLALDVREARAHDIEQRTRAAGGGQHVGQQRR